MAKFKKYIIRLIAAILSGAGITEKIARINKTKSKNDGSRMFRWFFNVERQFEARLLEQDLQKGYAGGSRS